MRTLDVVTSAFNEELNVAKLYSEIERALSLELDYSWKLIIADNGSTDDTWNEITKISMTNKNVVGLRLSRNFGLEGKC